MKVVILCGGKGIRAFPFTEYLPKPMLPVGGSPILVQIIRSFMDQGFSEFVLAAGHRKETLDDYFEGKNLGCSVDIVDTGEDSDTGERIRKCQHLVGEQFMATYGDGLSDVPLQKLVAFHKAHGGMMTVTSVPMFTQYGVLDCDNSGKVVQMREKPTLHDHRINIGFFVMNKTVFNHWQGTNLEKHVMPEMTRMGQLYSYRHDGFFKSVDSYKDQQEFDEIVRTGNIPWRIKSGAKP